MWVWIEKVGDRYVGVAHDDAGRQLLEITEPVAESEMRAQMAALSGEDQYDIDIAQIAADERPNDGHTPERKFFHLLRVRAKAGLASESDGAWVVDQLRVPNSIHRTIFLLWTLGNMGPRYEEAVRPFLDQPNTNGEAEYAMRALFQMGLSDKYVDRFVQWMRRGFGNSYGASVHAFSLSQNPKILQALIEASNDETERWTTRKLARHCLAQAIDLESAVENVLGRNLPPDDPYFIGVIEKAQTLLARLTAEGGERN